MGKYQQLHTPEEWDAIAKREAHWQAKGELEAAMAELFEAVERVQKAREALAKAEKEYPDGS